MTQKTDLFLVPQLKTITYWMVQAQSDKAWQVAGYRATYKSQELRPDTSG